MKFKTVAVGLSVIALTNIGAPTIKVFANEVNNNLANAIVQQNHVSTMKKFELESNKNFEGYKEKFKVSKELIEAVNTNGGQYASSAPDKAVDENPKTHWETGKPNSATFNNEFTVTFKELVSIDRITYQVRQDGTTKGFLNDYEVYGSISDADDDFVLITKGTGTTTKDTVEINFDKTKIKRIKIKFLKADRDWASISELGFYKEDIVQKTMDSLFVDANKNQVSEEYRDINKLNELENLAKEHPFYEDYKESIEDAKLILENNEIVSNMAQTKVFELYENEKYNELFQINKSNIASIKNNAGHYASQNIEKAVDGDVNTYWETNKSNTETWNNEVEIKFKERVVLDRVVYGARQSDTKGFAEEFEIYASNTSEGDTYQLVTTGKHNRVKGLVEAKFEPTQFKRIKFKFKKSNQNWATANEFLFYKEDAIAQKMKDIFTNGLMDELNEAYDSLEELNILENEAKKHPLYNEYKVIIDRAKNIINNNDEVKNERVVVGEQRGHYTTESGKRMINGAAYSSFESFGKYVTSGEEIVVYVDADPYGKMPELCLGQIGKDTGDWKRWISLAPGKNIIKVPTGINPSAIYLVNNASKEDQAYAPRVRIEGGTKFPIYFHGETDPKEFRKELEAYAAKIELDDEAFRNENPKNKVYNMAEFVSENVVLTTTALGAIKGLQKAEKEANLDISDTMNEWEKMYEMFQTFMGYEKDTTDEKNSYFPNKFVARVFQGVPVGYASHGYTGYRGSDNKERDGGFFSSIAMPPNMKGNDNWAYTHEFGHIFNTKYIVSGEVTNNLYAQEYRRLNADKGINADRADWNEIFKRFKGEEFEMSFFERLAVLSQLNIAYGYDAYAKASRFVRDNTDLIKSINGRDEQRLAVAYSLGLGVDLLDFFKDWNYPGIEITDQMREAVKGLSKPDKKIEYLHSGAYDYEGNGFSEDAKVNINSNVNKENNTVTLKFDIDKDNQADVLGYEILKNNKVIGFTKTNSFVIKEFDINEKADYSVVAYAKDLSTLKPIEIQILKPTLSIEENLTLALGDKFDVNEYVNAYDYEGNAIEEISIDSNVDTSKKGNYKVKYTATNCDVSVEKTMKVNVVSKITYASDTKEVSAKVGWGSFRKDKSPNNTTIKLDRQGVVTDYKKGLGAHANSEVVYDVKAYDRFESYIGIDKSVRESNSPSAAFKVYADGKEVYSSEKFTSTKDHEFISIDLREVSELKLVTDSLGNNSSDQTVWADAKFINDNTKPEIIAKDTQHKIGETIDFMEGVTAKDIEDGDLTSKIQIVSNNFEEGKSGRFTVEYKVVDSDGNETIKNRYVTVYSDLEVKKSKYGSFNNLDKYNEVYKIPAVSVSNNAGNYGSAVIGKAIDNDVNTHWETNSPNNDKFKNEVIFDLGQSEEIDTIAYASRRGGKGFANKFSIYASNEESGNDFILIGKGTYNGNANDVIEFDINNTTARRVKFVFDSAKENWASIGEMAFYKKDEMAKKVASMFTNSDKDEVTESYNKLDKINTLKEEVKNHPAYELFQDDFKKAEELVKSSFPTLNIPNSQSVKVGEVLENVAGEFSATDTKDGDLTSKVVVTGSENVNLNKTGEYELTYTITDSDDNTITKTRKISVIDMKDFNDLTKYEWSSAKQSYGSATKDLSASGKTLKLTGEDGGEVVFDKGIGAHSTSTVIYDLTDKNYARFTSYVGVDRAMYNSVGSVQFEVYVDNKIAFDSGVMNSKDTMKFVDIDLTDIKELKLIVKDGGNGNWSDHATWGGTKLHFVNKERADLSKLTKKIEEIEAVNKEEYTEESVKVLNIVIEEAKSLLNKDLITQDQCDEMLDKLQIAFDNLNQKEDLNQIVNIVDDVLRKAIKDNLKLGSKDITIGDMHKLTSLDLSYEYVRTLEGIEYAKNLEYLNLDYNELCNISPIKNLKNLKEFSGVGNFIAVMGTRYPKDNKFILEDIEVIDLNGERLSPKEIILSPNKNPQKLNLEEVYIDGKIVIDTALTEAIDSVNVVYESKYKNFSVDSFFMMKK